MSKIAVVILNWNGRPFLEKFLDVVLSRSVARGSEVEIVVADNGSGDDSLEWLSEHFGDSVRTIILAENYGFTGGYNRALAQVEADYFLLLNSDIEVAEGYLEPLLNLMEREPEVAAVQPKILSYDHPDRFEYAGASGGFIDTLGYPFCRGRLIDKTEQDRGQYDSERDIFWATGAALFVRASAYRAIGGLDEMFFAHMEEIDLCWRFKRAGYRIMVAPSSAVYHVGGGTLPAWSPAKTYYNFRNNLAMLYKNLSTFRFLLVFAVRFWTDSLRAFSYLTCGKMDFVKAIIKGHLDFWAMRSGLDRQRDLPYRRVGQIYRGSIVIRYFFNKNFDNII